MKDTDRANNANKLSCYGLSETQTIVAGLGVVWKDPMSKLS